VHVGCGKQVSQTEMKKWEIEKKGENIKIPGNKRTSGISVLIHQVYLLLTTTYQLKSKVFNYE
jgi:hypothetical protein